jgi:hypothetical protein
MLLGLYSEDTGHPCVGVAIHAAISLWSMRLGAPTRSNFCSRDSKLGRAKLGLKVNAIEHIKTTGEEQKKLDERLDAGETVVEIAQCFSEPASAIAMPV